MGIRGYISSDFDFDEILAEISKFSYRNYKLGPMAFEILTQFAEHRYKSTYQIFASSGTKKMAYKNVHKRIQKLHSLKLIEVVEEEEISPKRDSLHNPIYYKLTTGGIFQIIYGQQYTSFVEKQGLRLLLNYGRDIIFRALLYPYFDPNTLLKLNDYFMSLDILEEIFVYLYKCCVALNETIEIVSRKGSKMLKDPILLWNKPDQCSIWFLDSQFDLKLGNKSHIQKIDEKMMKISDGHESVTLTLNDKKDLAILTTDDNRNYELDVKRSKNKLTLYARRGTIREKACEKLAYDIEYSLLSFAFFMIMRLRKDDFTQVTAQITPVSSPASFKILLQDNRILSLLEKTRKLFNERYETFVDLRVT